MKFTDVCKDILMLRTPFCGSWSGVVLIRGDCNILIDSGASSDVVDDCIVPALNDIGLKPSDIDYLLLSHCHGDHVGGLRRLKEVTGGKIAVFEGSLDKIRDPLKYSRKIRAAFPDFSPPAPKTLEGIEPDILVKNGELLVGRLRLIYTPGHDDDTVCWYDEKHQTIISGDSLQANGTILQGIGFYQDLLAYRRSLKFLRQMDIRNLVPGHYYLSCPEIAFGYNAVTEYLKRCEMLTELYHNVINDLYLRGERDLSVFARALINRIGGIEPEYLFLSLYTVREHLKEITDAQ